MAAVSEGMAWLLKYSLKLSTLTSGGWLPSHGTTTNRESIIDLVSTRKPAGPSATHSEPRSYHPGKELLKHWGDP